MVQIYNFFEYHWTLIVILSDKLWLVLPYTQSDENVLFIFMVPDDIKEELLKVDHNIIEEQTAVCEEVVRQMVLGANELFHTDYAVAISGFAGPGGPDGGRSGVIVGTIWIAVGNKDNIITTIIEEDNGRDKNLASATNIAMHMLRDYLKENCEETEVIE